MKNSKRELLKCELCWIPVEMVMAAFALFLMLVLHHDDAAAYFFLTALGASGIVRTLHYYRLWDDRPQKGKA